MGTRLAADAILLLHALFILYVIFGSLVSLWRPRLAWLHALAVAWGGFVMLSGQVCPLTPLENSLRVAAGQVGYEGGFIDHYVTSLIYPEGLTRGVQMTLGALVLVGNAAVYLYIARRKRLRR